MIAVKEGREVLAVKWPARKVKGSLSSCEDQLEGVWDDLGRCWQDKVGVEGVEAQLQTTQLRISPPDLDCRSSVLGLYCCEEKRDHSNS